MQWQVFEDLPFFYFYDQIDRKSSDKTAFSSGIIQAGEYMAVHYAFAQIIFQRKRGWFVRDP
jgi:hypothetical protein